MITKPCAMCGQMIEVPDNRRKYCDSCREVRKHLFDKNALIKYREEAREKRLAEKKRLSECESRIKHLEGLIIKQQRHIQYLEGIIKSSNL